MFQFRRFPAYAYLIQRTLTEYCSAGFPHSVISGSLPMCGSPKLIAACHDLHRLLMPRHSPCALISLTSSAWTPYRSPRPAAKAHSLRHASSPSRTRFAGLRSGLRADFVSSIAYGPLKSGSQESCRLQSYLANCFYPFVSTICSTLLLALPFWNYHSHCSVFKVRAPTFLRSDFSIQPTVGY